MTPIESGEATTPLRCIRFAPNPGIEATPAETGETGELDDWQGAGHLVSGGGLVGEVHGTLGLIRLRSSIGETSLAVAVADGLPDGGVRTRILAGGWTRRIALTERRTLIETGLLADSHGAVALSWHLDPTGPDAPASPERSVRISLRVGPPGSPDAIALTLTEGEPPIALALAPAGTQIDERSVERHLRPLRARQLQRASRFRDEEADSGGLDLRWVSATGEALPDLRRARRQLDAALPDRSGAALALGTASPDSEGDAPDAPRIRVLGWPERATASTSAAPATSARAEAGIALLLLGWHEAARLQLHALASYPRASPHGLLHLASLWAGWTGRPEVLVEYESALNAAAAALTPGDRSAGGAAWPRPSRLVHALSDALEPTGREEWRTALQVRSALLSPGPDTLRLPPVSAFEGSGRGGASANSTVRAARLVRSWVEGQLGARAEASWGRLTLRPLLGDAHPGEALPPPRLGTLEVRGLRAGRARVELHCRRDGGHFTFRLAQTHGRIPLNVILEPWLPLREVHDIRLAGERVDLDVTPEGPGVRVRLQFPLDPERRLTIDGEY